MQLLYIHIGKCGGSTVWDAVQKSLVVRQNFSSVDRIHIKKPPYKIHAKYLIVIRNPIQRAISAWNWRSKIVNTFDTEKHKFPGEFETLNKYNYNISNIAESLYTENKLNASVVEEFMSVHHLKENISHYLNDGFLSKIKQEQIWAVFTQETLNEDIYQKLRMEVNCRLNKNRPFVDINKKKLTKQAYHNLNKFLRKDYKCIEKLIHFNKVNNKAINDLLK